MPHRSSEFIRRLPAVSGRRRVVAALAAAMLAVAVLAIGAIATAHGTKTVRAVALLTVARGHYVVSLGDPPVWLPLAGHAETLTLIAGPPRRRGVAADTAYVGFTRATRGCTSTPATSRAPYYSLPAFFSSVHSARSSDAFAPDGGAAPDTFIDSVAGVVIHQSGSTRACIWLAGSAGVPAKHHRRPARSLVASIVVPLLNNVFAASVSNLNGAGAGSGGYTMYAFDGGHAFRYSGATVQCGRTSSDGASSVSAGTPGSETVSISPSPCTGDESTFTFSADGLSESLGYPISDALASPAVSVGVGGCELDPLTGVSLTLAEQYLTSVGCTVGLVELTPFERSLPRGSVSWAAVDGGVAELAPSGSRVDLVLNGRP